MAQLLNALNNHSEEIQQVFLIGSVIFGLLLEGLLPMRVVLALPLARWINNLLLTGFNYLLRGMSAPLLYGTLVGLNGAFKQGLLTVKEVDFVTSFVVIFFASEALSYMLHRLFHTVPVLWRLHAVHHSDTEVDVTTTERHHPLEVLLSTCVTLPAMLLLGPDTSVIVVYGMFSTVISMVSHCNLEMNPKIERALSLVLVTPNFHRVHHSSNEIFTNSNYGTICSIYDRLFGTAKFWSLEQQKTLQLGLEYMREPRATRFDQMMIMPWRIPLR